MYTITYRFSSVNVLLAQQKVSMKRSPNNLWVEEVQTICSLKSPNSPMTETAAAKTIIVRSAQKSLATPDNS